MFETRGGGLDEMRGVAWVLPLAFQVIEDRAQAGARVGDRLALR